MPKEKMLNAWEAHSITKIEEVLNIKSAEANLDYQSIKQKENESESKWRKRIIEIAQHIHNDLKNSEHHFVTLDQYIDNWLNEHKTELENQYANDILTKQEKNKMKQLKSWFEKQIKN